VGTQTQDVPLFLDALNVLREIGGAYAEQKYANIQDIYIRVPDAPKRGRAPDADQKREFERSCSALREQAVAEFRTALDRVGLEDCLALAILLGQYDVTANSPTGTPNVFTPEMELIASCSSRLRSRWTWRRRRYKIAFRVLQLARRIQSLDLFLAEERIPIPTDHTFESYRAQPGFLGMLSSRTMLTHGSFNTLYDWEYCALLAHRMRQHGVRHPRIEALQVILSSVMDRWVPSIESFREEAARLGGPLHKVATTFRLTDVDATSLPRIERSLINRYAKLLFLSRGDLLADLPEVLEPDGDDWLNLFAASTSSLGQNHDTRTIFEAPLVKAPILKVGDCYLLTLVHSLSTELSLVLEDKFSSSLGETYFRARAKQLEESAVYHLQNVLKGSKAILGGIYGRGKRDESIEVDGVVVWRDIALIVESKGGFLSPQARHGSDVAANADLKKTIGDGYFQASRLLKELDRVGQATLTNGQNEQLILNAKALRRIYVIIPTADNLDGVSTALERLWRNGIIPNGSIPLVCSVQDLHLMSHILRTPLDLVSYLEYREEILTDDKVLVMDEQEILGNFVGGIDVHGNLDDQRGRFSYQLSRPEWKRLHEVYYIGSDAQEKYLNPWIFYSFRALASGSEVPSPPSRHMGESRRAIDQLVVKGDFWAAVDAMQVARTTFDSAFSQSVEARPGQPIRLGAAGIGAVYMHPRDSFSRVKRMPPIQEVRTLSRYVLYLVTGRGINLLRTVERGRQHPFFRENEQNLVRRSRTGRLNEWFDVFAKQRKPARADLSTTAMKLEQELVEAGLDESSARGAVRLGIAESVKDLTALDVPIARAANLWMTQVRECAARRGVAVADFPIRPAQLAEALALVDAARVDPADLGHLIDLLAESASSSPEALAESHGLILSSETGAVQAAITAAAERLSVSPIAYSQLGAKAKGRLRSRLIGEVRSALPSPNMKIVVSLVDEFLDSFVEGRD
jgi:hypothetical protein